MEIKRKSGYSMYIRKIHFKTKTVIREKVGHYIIIKGSIQEDITLVNRCATYIRAHKHIKQILKGDTDRSTVMGGNLNNSLVHQRTGYPDRKSIRKHRP